MSTTSNNTWYVDVDFPHTLRRRPKVKIRKAGYTQEFMKYPKFETLIQAQYEQAKRLAKAYNERGKPNKQQKHLDRMDMIASTYPELLV